MNSIELSIFSSRIEAVCEEMGEVLRFSAFSPNIKDRLDFSCAIFDAQGELCAQAAHIPVHLGSMAYAMRDIVNQMDWHTGDMVVLNDPYMGGTHLPDVTMIAPLFVEQQLVAFVVNRAHHADIGAKSPGSMPLSHNLQQEGLVISPQHIMRDNTIEQVFLDEICHHMASPKDAAGDFLAQISANQTGLERLAHLLNELSIETFKQAVDELNAYAQRLAQSALAKIPTGEYQFQDVMDDDGMDNYNIPIQVNIQVLKDKGAENQLVVDFAGTSEQVKGNINCPLSVAAAAVYYVFRCLMPDNTPACAGSFRHIKIKAEKGSLLNANFPAAVAAGNVETSTRIVDVILGALNQAIPELIPAASHGSMNNVAMGGGAYLHYPAWNYYETIGGGMGASRLYPGLDAVQTHMTNTLNTPVESLEYHFPLRVNRYAIRTNSGGEGQHRGGDGIERQIEFLAPAQVTLLTERRYVSPWGGAGGGEALTGDNRLDGQSLGAKSQFLAQPGQVLNIKTPGGGAWGEAS